ncbi:putative ribosomal protein L18 [Helianthus annuus]|nr:putative ribosomal protein L18 [Helianthus annuus]
MALNSSFLQTDMVIPPPVKAQRITNFLKPYLLKMHFSNKFVSAQVIHAPTATVAAAATSQEKLLREAWTQTQQSTRDISAAAKIGKILGERLLVNDIPAVSVVYKKKAKISYHGKVRTVIDSLREAGVKLL